VTNRREGRQTPGHDVQDYAAYKRHLHRLFSLYVLGLLLFLA